MAIFHLIVKGSCQDADLALTRRGLDGVNGIQHIGKITCQVRGPPQLADTLSKWLLETTIDAPLPAGSLLWFTPVK